LNRLDDDTLITVNALEGPDRLLRTQKLLKEKDAEP